MSEKETIKFDAEIDKVFQLMIHSLYEKKEIFLRELLSNASDACDKLRYKAIEKPELMQGDQTLHIEIIADKKNKTLTVKDNGIGMSKQDLIKNLGTIAKSGTQNFLSKLTGEAKTDSQLIGQFGVGFYSSFMVANKVDVISRAAGANKKYKWSSKGEGGKFTIEEYEDDHDRGTSIVLYLKDDELEYLDEFRVGFITETYSNHIAFDINWVNDEVKEGEVAKKKLNSGSAIWMKNKSELSDDDYKEFYKNITHSGIDAEPWMTLHNRAEGAIEYTNLLFIPTVPPMDLYHPDRKTQVKLYIKRVFIADDALDIIPPYLRFMRGVIDSEDLPLNISRESVQNNRTVQKIKRSVTKKIINELIKKADNDSEDYQKFWKKFGSVIKEGLCDGLEPRNDIIEVCRFRTTKSGDKMIGLKDYVNNMHADQDAVYYITGSDYESAINSPQLEGFKANDIEVVILTDSVDEFWVNVLNFYQDYDLKSVTREGSDLKNKAGKSENDSNAEKNDEPAIENINGKDSTKFIDFIKATLGNSVMNVRTTGKLTDSPVCLSVPDGMMDIRMERFMVENKQLATANAKNFDINPSHPIIEKLAKDFDEGSESMEKLSDTVHLLFAQANIIEGEPIADASKFAKRLNNLIEKSLAA